MSSNFIQEAVSYNADGWKITLDNVDFFITKEGAQLAPAVFHTSGGDIEPYHLTPWQNDDKSSLKGALKNLRGDFFCMPFGGNAEEFQGEKHPAHGEVTGDPWHLISAEQNGDTTEIKIGITVKVRKADVVKTIKVNRNHSVFYFKHQITGASGTLPLGHHPIVKMPEKGEHMYLSLGSFDFGMTCPGIFSNPEKEAYQILDRGKEFDSIERIPSLLRDTDTLDYSVFPSPYGFTDLFSVFKKPGKDPAWCAAVYPEKGYLWFALKDAAVLPSTTIWISNSGRFFHPWNGHTYCIGIEDTCSYFAEGYKSSVEHNFLNDKGFRTASDLTGGLEIRHIQGVAPVPHDFGKVADVRFADGSVVFADRQGKTVSVPVDHSFVMKQGK